MKKQKIKQNKNPRLKIILVILGIWWALAFFIAACQFYIMSRVIISLPIGLILSFIVFWLHLFLYKKIKQEKKLAIIILYIYAVIHFIPLVLQLTGMKTPGLDNVVVAVIGLLLVYTKEKNDN